jgi:hypothetical protein
MSFLFLPLQIFYSLHTEFHEFGKNQPWALAVILPLQSADEF